MANNSTGRPSAVVLLYDGWQIWDGQYQPVRVGHDLVADVEFVQSSALTVEDPTAELGITHVGANKYEATARVLETTDAVVLDLGSFRALRWVRPGETAGDFALNRTVSLTLKLGLNGWPHAEWSNKADKQFATRHQWHVSRIVRVADTGDGREVEVDISEAAMETVASLHEYCLLYCEPGPPLGRG